MNSAVSQIATSFGWQAVFISFAIVMILLEIIHGWRIGLMRQLVRIIAIVAAYACAFFAGSSVLPMARSFVKLPDPILIIFGGVVLGALVFAVLNGLGPILFRRTADHKSRIVRLLWGIGGGLLGIVLGAFTIWLVFAGARLVGSVAQAQVLSQHALTSATLQPIWNRPLQIQSEMPARDQQPSPLMVTLSELKSSLESGPIGATLSAVDPLPQNMYRTLERIGEVASNPESAERFLQFPGAQQIARDPKIIALRDDPRVTALISQGHILELLQNERVVEALNDPALIARFKKFDLERALDYALKK